jgi:hypothetical protein
MFKRGKLNVGGCEYDLRELEDLEQQSLTALSAARAFVLRTADPVTKQAGTDLLQAAAQVHGQVGMMRNLLSMSMKMETESEDGRSRR